MSRHMTNYGHQLAGYRMRSALPIDQLCRIDHFRLQLDVDVAILVDVAVAQLKLQLQQPYLQQVYGFARPHWPMRTSFSVVGVDKRFAIRSIEWPRWEWSHAAHGESSVRVAQQQQQ